MKIWLCDLTYDQQVLAADTIPTNIGYIASYVLHNCGSEHEIKLFKYPGKLIKAIESEPLPQVIGFSHFIWNSRLGYAFAEKIKKINRKIVTVFGGMHYPNTADKQKQWFLEHPAADFFIYKEGERAFLELLRALMHNGVDISLTKKNSMSGVHCLREGGMLLNPEAFSRIEDLSSFPSPYLSGILDEFFDGRLMPLLTTNRGCPFTCTYCSEGNSYYNKVFSFSKERIRDEIAYIAKKINLLPASCSRRDLYISDSNFGMYKEDIDTSVFLRQTREKSGWPVYVLASTGKKNKERVLEVSKILEGSIKLSGSVQSLDKQVLKNINRDNINAKELMQMALESSRIGANSYSEVILGLPGDSLCAHESSLRQVINARFDFVTPWQLVILPGADMATDVLDEKYAMKTRYRVLTKSYGNYFFKDGDGINVVEIEEICVGGIYLSFEDYLQARFLHLIINIFYNDRFFSGILKFLDSLGIERYEWVKTIAEQGFSLEPIAGIFREFMEETKKELWDDKEKLLHYVSDEKIVAKYIDGVFGANVIAKYRIIAISDYIKNVCQLAKKAAISCLERTGKDDSESREFLEELVAFEYESKRDIFVVDLVDNVVKFSFDILKFLQDSEISDFKKYKLSKPVCLKFYRQDEAKSIVERSRAVFGTSIAAKYKQLTRVPIKKIYRNATYVL